LTKDSCVLANQIRTVDEKRFVKIYGRVGKEVMKDFDKALRISQSL
jgi:mRNA-degrading endonuclease toxin of MazEF toxin-antitoxin module